MKTGKESTFILKSISDFLASYAPLHLTTSEHTLKSYRVTLNKYLSFLERKGYTTQTIDKCCFEHTVIEEWMRYMRNEENLQPDTCNIRLGAMRTFLKYLKSRDPAYQYLYIEAIDIPLMKTEKTRLNLPSGDQNA